MTSPSNEINPGSWPFPKSRDDMAAEITRLRGERDRLAKALRAYRRFAECRCSINQIQNGHKMGCMLPALDEGADVAIASLQKSKS